MSTFHQALTACFAEDFATLAENVVAVATSWSDCERRGRDKAAFVLWVALLDHAKRFHDSLAGWAKMGFCPTVEMALAGTDQRWRLLVAAYDVGAASAGSEVVPVGVQEMQPVLLRLEAAARGA